MPWSGSSWLRRPCIAGFDALGGAGTARLVALLSLLTYLVFMATVITSK